MPWRVAHASVIGSSHLATGTDCQDVGACRVITGPDQEGILVAIACDGAGSAAQSRAGSSLVVERFLLEFGAACGEAGLSAITKEFVSDWLARVRAAIADRAASEGLSPRDFACTVIGAVVGNESHVFFQIGDGAIVVSHWNEPEYNWVFWPQHGEFANETSFITDENAPDILREHFEAQPRHVDEIAIFTDGIEGLILDFQSRAAHTPFFQTLFGWLVTMDTAAPNEEIPESRPIAQYLGSTEINERTDDDKTLILATRRAALTQAKTPEDGSSNKGEVDVH
jgi:hypothetical protein